MGKIQLGHAYYPGGPGRQAGSVGIGVEVYVLHCFQKKSKQGIATPKADIDLVKARLKIAESLSNHLREDGSLNAKENDKPNR